MDLNYSAVLVVRTTIAQLKTFKGPLREQLEAAHLDPVNIRSVGNINVYNKSKYSSSIGCTVEGEAALTL